MEGWRRSPYARTIPLPTGLCVETPRAAFALDAEGKALLEGVLSGATPADAEVLEDLASDGVIVPSGAPDGWASAVLASAAAPSVAIGGEGAVVAAFAEALAAAGLPVAPEGEADVEVCLVHRSQGALARATARRWARSGTRGVVVEWHGLRLAVGPWQADGACWECADLREWSNAEDPALHRVLRETPSEGAALLPLAPFVPLAAMVVARAALFAAAGRETGLEDTRWTFDLVSMSTSAEPVLPVPSCPACSLRQVSGVPSVERAK